VKFNNSNIEQAPAPALNIRLLDRLVRIFPRRLFILFSARTEAKFSFHPLLLCRSLSPANPDLPAGYAFDLLNEDWLNAMIHHKEALPAAVYHNRLAKGDQCYCLAVNGELVAYQWVTRQTCCIFRGMDQEIDFLPLEPNQAFSYDFYTYRNHRNKGYGSLLKKHFYKAISEKGGSEIISCVLPNNKESRNIHLREGFSLKALPYNYRIKNWSTTLWSSEAKVNETVVWLEQIRKTLKDN
jgi:GNAT superfamily N-acetyltransferase